MSCTVQLLDPQVLGVRGDVAFDETGNVTLGIGQLDVSVEFLYEKAGTDYRFEYCYVDDTSSVPQDIRAVITEQTTKGFEARLSGAPVTANCSLRWHAIRPDPVQINQPLTPGPTYAILRPSQSGIKTLTENQSYVIVTFDTAQPDNDWVFEALSIESDNSNYQQVFAWLVTSHTTGGFRLELSGAPDTILDIAFSGYKLRWRIA